MNDVLFLKVMELHVKITAPKPIISGLWENHLLLSSVIPLLEISDSSDNSCYEINILQGRFYNVIKKKSSLQYNVPKGDFNFSSFAYTILTPVFSALLLRRNLLFLHGAVVDYKGEGIVIWGNGKTSTALSLCNSDPGFAFVAEDNFVLDIKSNEIMSGSRLVHNKNPSINPDLSKRIELNRFNFKTKKGTTLKLLIYPQNFFDAEDIIDAESFEKSSIICSFINERLYNLSRWHQELQQQPPNILVINDLSKKNEIITKLLTELRVIKVQAAIKNIPSRIVEYLKYKGI